MEIGKRVHGSLLRQGHGRLTGGKGRGSVVLVQAAKRNLDRFSGDLMFQLDSQNVAALKSQSVISSPR